MTFDATPDSALAGALAAAAMGAAPTAVSRFATGSHHYVFEVAFAARPPVVVRLNDERGRAAMTGAAELSRLLRPLGVPLPRILAEDLRPPFPHLILERLPGTDLGHVARELTAPQLDSIAAAVARAQSIAAGTPSAGRYGYAVKPEDAPRRSWSEVVSDSVERSRHRASTAGLFDLAPIEAVAALVEASRPALDAQPATPFLHDTTTKNVIVAPHGSFSGIVDVDDLCFGDPRYPVALTLASLAVSGGPVSYAEAWLRHAGLVDNRLFRLYVALFLIDFMAEHGQVFNGNQRPSLPQERAHLLDVFAIALPRAAG